MYVGKFLPGICPLLPNHTLFGYQNHANWMFCKKYIPYSGFFSEIKYFVNSSKDNTDEELR